MGSAGLQFDAADTIDSIRLNQKSRFVGTGAQINALATTYAGQEAFCTSTGSGYTVEHIYVRDSTNTTWVDKQTLQNVFVESSETSSTPVTDGADFTATAGTRYYAFYTMPTTASLYLITTIEWKNGATVAGNVIAGVDIIDADPAVLAHTPLIALTQQVAQTGTSTTQKVSITASSPVRAGAVLGIWVSCSNGTATLREQTGLTSQNQTKATAYSATPSAADNTAWSTATARKYIKLYYRSYA